MPTRSDVVQDAVLSNVSVKYTNADYIAERLLPRAPVRKQKGGYYVYGDSHLRPVDDLRAAGSPANEVDYDVSFDGTYYAHDHALKEFIPNEVEDQADEGIKPLVDATENVTERIQVNKEKALATVMAATATITSNDTLSGTDQWSDYNNSDPFDDIETAKQTIHSNIFREPNTLVLQKQVFDKLKHHPDLLERIKYSARGVTTAQVMAELFGVSQVLVAGAGYNSADEGQDDAHSYIWGKHAWLVYVAPQVRLKQPTFGYTFTYENRMAERWTDGDRKGTYVRVHENYDQAVVATGACYLIKNAIA